MNKLVSKSPILRFKLGKVIKAQSGFKTAKRHDYTKGAVKYEKDKNGRWLANYVNGPDTKQYYVAEGERSGQFTFGLVDNPELILKQGGQITKAYDGTKFNGYQKADQKTVNTLNKYFESVPNEKLIKPLEYIAPGSYNLQGVTFNRGNIRNNRNMYKTVDDYWKYLNSDEGRNSNDFRLWQNIMRTQDGNLNREAFDEIMSKYGISGNLGRRDSGRLANVLNTLNEIGTNGSEARKAFINSYNTAFIPATEARVANVAPTGTPTSIIINRNTQPVSTQSVSTTRRFVIPDFAGLIRSLALSSPFFRYAKQGGKLISRNPVKQFKQK